VILAAQRQDAHVPGNAASSFQVIEARQQFNRCQIACGAKNDEMAWAWNLFLLTHDLFMSPAFKINIRLAPPSWQRV
jgi:hypothetical protein